MLIKERNVLTLQVTTSDKKCLFLENQIVFAVQICPSLKTTKFLILNKCLKSFTAFISQLEWVLKICRLPRLGLEPDHSSRRRQAHHRRLRRLRCPPLERALAGQIRFYINKQIFLETSSLKKPSHFIKGGGLNLSRSCLDRDSLKKDISTVEIFSTVWKRTSRQSLCYKVPIETLDLDISKTDVSTVEKILTVFKSWSRH